LHKQLQILLHLRILQSMYNAIHQQHFELVLVSLALLLEPLEPLELHHQVGLL
jgi:hypothetical protein